MLEAEVLLEGRLEYDYMLIVENWEKKFLEKNLCQAVHPFGGLKLGG